MNKRRVLSAVLASLGAFSSLMAAGKNDNNVKNKRGGGEDFINKNVPTRGKSQKIKNSKSFVSESGQKAKPGSRADSNSRRSNVGDRRQKERSNSVDNKKQYVNFV